MGLPPPRLFGSAVREVWVPAARFLRSRTSRLPPCAGALDEPPRSAFSLERPLARLAVRLPRRPAGGGGESAEEARRVAGRRLAERHAEGGLRGGCGSGCPGPARRRFPAACIAQRERRARRRARAGAGDEPRQTFRGPATGSLKRQCRSSGYGTLCLRAAAPPPFAALLQ